MRCARRVCGNSLWLGVMTASTCVVPTVVPANFARSRTCPAMSAWCRWTSPAVLWVERRPCVSTGDPALCACPVRSGMPAGLTLSGWADLEVTLRPLTEQQTL